MSVHFEIDFEPVGKRVSGAAGETLLQAAQRAGIVLNAVCGGEGVCGRCRVRVMAGALAAPQLNEEDEYTPEQLAEGWRLACRVEIQGDLRVHIPPESLATAQRTQTEGQSLEVAPAPSVTAHSVELERPSMHDLRSDARRIRAALGAAAVSAAGLVFPAAVLRTISEDLRANDYRVSVLRRGNQVVGVRPYGSPALGFAVDLGTTKLAGYLVDLASGETLAAAGAMNPQIAYGEDIMSRLGHALQQADGRQQLQGAIVAALNDLAGELCRQAGAQRLDIGEAVVVGNTAMHHLFLGLPVRQLALAPYVAAESEALDWPAAEAGLELAPGANLHTLPNIAGFVGADHVAMLLASGMTEQSGVVLGLDIGTNTEVSLVAHGRHWSCSTASGPAFEGAHIRHGMRAAPGAIESLVIRDGQVNFKTIGDQPPVGLCGSGILDAVAQLRLAEIVNRRGAMLKPGEHARILGGDHGSEFLLVTAGENEGRQITFSRSDVNEIQLAKGAMRAGVNVLLERAGIEESQIDEVIIAGAFGTYLDVQSGVDIGMFPRLPRSRFRQVGNAAGAGARMALLSTVERERARRIAEQVEYVELTSEPGFAKRFARALWLE